LDGLFDFFRDLTSKIQTNATNNIQPAQTAHINFTGWPGSLLVARLITSGFNVKEAGSIIRIWLHFTE
jgi:hypothetical protein